MTLINAGIYYYTPASPNIPLPLPIIASRLRTEIVDLTATHTLTQIFRNPPLKKPTKKDTDHIREAKYTFPLYESCAVREFSAEIGSKFITGVVKPKSEAKAAYEAAKAAGKQAALLEQNTGEVFTTSIGNIRPGEFVSVVIKYVHELKQDIEVEGVKLVIPTIIAPKYGWENFDKPLYVTGWRNQWSTMSREIEEAAGGKLETTGLAIEVVATMNGSIRGIQSPSHPISVNIGSHDASGQGEFSPKMARATLATASTSITGLDKDFSLVINSTDISLPRAFLAPHPTLPSTSTLLVTLAPRFELPQQRPEVVFVVDRSGSMNSKILTVRSALQLFLASLPVGVFFNIVSFGSHHSSLWPTSQPYNAETLEAAKSHVDKMDANMGGTEMFSPCEFAIKNRREDLKLEVLVLTDGEIWNTAQLFGYINKASSSGDVRFFSLGVGRSVSHLLVEGIGRAGKGYSQIVGEGENMQRKVMRMLKAALTPHVNDWSIDWDGKSAIMSSFKDSQEIADAPVVHATISLFDPSCNPDNAPAPTPSLPALPPILQAPATIPPLYPFTRTIVYMLLTDPCTPPNTVDLAGNAYDSNTNSIHPLKITIPVTRITSPSTSLGLYSLLGRKLLQDLEEGRCGYLPATSSLTEAEGTRLGVTFGLASKWTSFVAVTSSREDRANKDKTPPSDDGEEGWVLAGVDGDVAMKESHLHSGILPGMSGSRTRAAARGGSAQSMASILPAGMGSSVLSIQASGATLRGSAVPGSRRGSSSTGGPMAKKKKCGGEPQSLQARMENCEFGQQQIPQQQMQQLQMQQQQMQQQIPQQQMQQQQVQQQIPQQQTQQLQMKQQRMKPQQVQDQGRSYQQQPAQSQAQQQLEHYQLEHMILRQERSKSSPRFFQRISDTTPPAPPIDKTPSGLITALSRLQLFSGYFPLSIQLFEIVGLPEVAVDGAKQRLGIAAGDGKMETALATCIVLVWLKKQLKDYEEEWELIAEKAKGCVENDIGKEEMMRIEVEVESILSA